ncbi:MAG: hypothetical protein V1867_02140 [Candidatus Falkowbacteria bacterium]
MADERKIMTKEGIYEARVDNPSFEEDKPGQNWIMGQGGTWVNNIVSGWKVVGPRLAGTFRPDKYIYPGGVPDGYNVAWTNGGSIRQVLKEKVTAGFVYVLQVYVGKRVDHPCGSYAIELCADGNILVSESSLEITPGKFSLSRAVYTASELSLYQGMPLEIRLNGRTQANFDKVSLRIIPSETSRQARIF